MAATAHIWNKYKNTVKYSIYLWPWSWVEFSNFQLQWKEILSSLKFGKLLTGLVTSDSIALAGVNIYACMWLSIILVLSKLCAISQYAWWACDLKAKLRETSSVFFLLGTMCRSQPPPLSLSRQIFKRKLHCQVLEERLRQGSWRVNMFHDWSIQVELSGAIGGHDEASLPPDLDGEGAWAGASLARESAVKLMTWTKW